MMLISNFYKTEGVFLYFFLTRAVFLTYNLPLVFALDLL